MISPQHAELLDLPLEAAPEEAREHCHQLLEQLGLYLQRAPASHPNRPVLEARKADLQQTLRELSLRLGPTTSHHTTSTRFDTTRLHRAEDLSDEIRQTLELDRIATPAEALIVAEARLQKATHLLGSASPKHPSYPHIRRDHDRLVGIIHDLRSLGRGAAAESKTESPTATTPGPLARAEMLLSHGMAWLDRSPYDLPRAGECELEMRRETAGKPVPEDLRRRMQALTDRLAQVRQIEMRKRVEEMLKQIAASLDQEPPPLAELHDQLAAAAMALKGAPDEALQQTLDGLNAKFKTLEVKHAQPQTITFTQHNESHIEHGVTGPLPESLKRNIPARMQQTAAEPEEPREETRIGTPVEEEATSTQPPRPAVTVLRNPEPAGRKNPVVRVPTPAQKAGAPSPTKTPPRGPTAPAPKAKANDGLPPKPSRRTELILVVVVLAVLALADGVYVGIKSWQKTREASAPVAQSTTETQPVTITPPATPSAVPTRPLPETNVASTSVTAISNAVVENIPTNATTNAATNSVIIQAPPTAPALPTVFVKSQPWAEEIFLQFEEGGQTYKYANNAVDGVQLVAGQKLQISLAVPNYEPVVTNIDALTNGEKRVVDFGALKMLNGSLQLKVEPADARFSVIYPGREPIACPPGPLIENLPAGVEFQVVAERKGYAPATNKFRLKPQEIQSFDFGALQALPTLLLVSAPQEPFDLKVAWDGSATDYGTAARAERLPYGKSLRVTIALANFEPASTNITLEAGETRRLNFTHLEPIKGYLLVTSQPAGAGVTYRVDGQRLFNAGATNRINNIPLGHTVTVTLVKDGYADTNLTMKLMRSGQTLDFGKLVMRPHKVMLQVTGPNTGADVYVNGLNTGRKNGDVIPNFTSGQSYTILLRKAGKEDLARVVTISGDNMEQSEFFPEMQAGGAASDADEVLRSINASLITVKDESPLNAERRRTWTDWISQVQTSYENDPAVWPIIRDPLNKLRALVTNP